MPNHSIVLATHAHRMRQAPTPSEARLWLALRSSQLGVAFRRQVVLDSFIVDFFAPYAGLVVEVDGAYHARRRHADARRDARLARAGYRVLRLQADLVHRDLSAAVSRIVAVLEGRAGN